MSQDPGQLPDPSPLGWGSIVLQVLGAVGGVLGAGFGGKFVIEWLKTRSGERLAALAALTAKEQEVWNVHKEQIDLLRSSVKELRLDLIREKDAINLYKTLAERRELALEDCHRGRRKQDEKIRVMETKLAKAMRQIEWFQQQFAQHVPNAPQPPDFDHDPT